MVIGVSVTVLLLLITMIVLLVVSLGQEKVVVYQPTSFSLEGYPGGLKIVPIDVTD